MNRIAKELNLKDSFFANPHGLANKFNKSTASDIAVISKEALKNKLVQKIVSTKIYLTHAIDQDVLFSK